MRAPASPRILMSCSADSACLSRDESTSPGTASPA
ncbi:MAG: hypothetical protein EPO08_07095 [Rhodospirillaceae bacterium]|nr:MAG: hypothetical protein EPO08_07095 [Rhodospirillaceae bacterium]